MSTRTFAPAGKGIIDIHCRRHNECDSLHTFEVSVQDAIAVEVVETKKSLVEIAEHDRFMEHPMLVQKAGKASPGHPLHEDVYVSALLDRPVHPHDMRVLQLADQQHLLPDQLLHALLLLLRVAQEGDLLGGHQGASPTGVD